MLRNIPHTTYSLKSIFYYYNSSIRTSSRFITNLKRNIMTLVAQTAEETREKLFNSITDSIKSTESMVKVMEDYDRKSKKRRSVRQLLTKIF